MNVPWILHITQIACNFAEGMKLESDRSLIQASLFDFSLQNDPGL